MRRGDRGAQARNRDVSSTIIVEKKTRILDSFIYFDWAIGLGPFCQGVKILLG
jgi:hypothetical protein